MQQYKPVAGVDMNCAYCYAEAHGIDDVSSLFPEDSATQQWIAQAEHQKHSKKRSKSASGGAS